VGGGREGGGGRGEKGEGEGKSEQMGEGKGMRDGEEGVASEGWRELRRGEGGDRGRGGK